MTTKEIFLIAGLIIVAVGLFLFFNMDEGKIATVTSDGKILYEIDISKVRDPYEIEIEGPYPAKILVEHDCISFVNAQCPDKICVKTGKISKRGQSAVCLPGKISIYISGESAIDATTG